jgi:hypothetical protein
MPTQNQVNDLKAKLCALGYDAHIANVSAFDIRQETYTHYLSFEEASALAATGRGDLNLYDHSESAGIGRRYTFPPAMTEADFEYSVFDCAAFDHHWRTLAKQDTAATMWLVTSEESKARIRQEWVEHFNQSIADRIDKLVHAHGLSNAQQTELTGLLLMPELTVETANDYLTSLSNPKIGEQFTLWRGLELAQVASRAAGNPTAFFMPAAVVQKIYDEEKKGTTND